MTRKSRREIERALEEIGGKNHPDVEQSLTKEELINEDIERVNDRIVRLTGSGEHRLLKKPTADEVREALRGED